MQLGFVIDHTRCIGCHACTVACKSENHVPLGSFRTWVKYTEEGSFPAVRRGFAVLRCNQCSDAPCVTICPVSALEKRADGVVDVDPAACIGCKACTHACPYDAIYINAGTGLAEKCHFCVHRTELGVAPACAVVCPTEAIIPGDFDDPASRVSQLAAAHELEVRKPEAGTGPNVRYREVTRGGIDPGATNLSHGFIWSRPPTGLRVAAQELEARELETLTQRAQARTVYDVPREALWGWKVSGYLFFKSLAAGVFAAGFLAGIRIGDPGDALSGALVSMFFLAVTCLLLLVDLRRPGRFHYILLRPNWSSWLTRGTFLILGYGGLLAACVLGDLGGGFSRGMGQALGALTLVLGLCSAAYTGLLFAQARGRVLWMKRGYALHLVAQALLAGSAWLLVFDPPLGVGAHRPASDLLPTFFVAALLAHGLFMLFESRLAPVGREREYRRAARLVTHGPLARRHWGLGVGLGVVLPLVLLLLPLSLPLATPLAGILALVGLACEEHVFVQAGQALPIS